MQFHPGPIMDRLLKACELAGVIWVVFLFCAVGAMFRSFWFGPDQFQASIWELTVGAAITGAYWAGPVLVAFSAITITATIVFGWRYEHRLQPEVDRDVR